MSIFVSFCNNYKQFDYQKHPDKPKIWILILLKYDYFTYAAPRYYIYKCTVQISSWSTKNWLSYSSLILQSKLGLSVIVIVFKYNVIIWKYYDYNT